MDTTVTPAPRNSLHKLWIDVTKRSALVKNGKPNFCIGDESGFRVMWIDFTEIFTELWWSCWAFADYIRRDKMLLLYACLLVDFIGILSYLLLFIGEVTDLWW